MNSQEQDFICQTKTCNVFHAVYSSRKKKPKLQIFAQDKRRYLDRQRVSKQKDVVPRRLIHMSDMRNAQYSLHF